MSIPIQCGQCGKRYQAPDAFAGRSVKCKDCGAAIPVPSPTPAPAPARPNAAPARSSAPAAASPVRATPSPARPATPIRSSAPASPLGPSAKSGAPPSPNRPPAQPPVSPPMSRGLSDLLDEEDIGGSYGVVAEPVMATVVPVQPTPQAAFAPKKGKKKKKRSSSGAGFKPLLVLGGVLAVSLGVLSIVAQVYFLVTEGRQEGKRLLTGVGVSFAFISVGFAWLKRAAS